jgi:hypothetical protein
MYNLTSSCPFTGQLHQSDEFNHITISSSSLALSHWTFQAVYNETEFKVLEDFNGCEKSHSMTICPNSIKTEFNLVDLKQEEGPNYLSNLGANQNMDHYQTDSDEDL